MKCHETEQYIYLGDGESPDDKTKIEFDEHIRICDKCAAELAKSKKYFSLVSGLQKIEPKMETASLVSGQIIKQIESEKTRFVKSLFENILDSLYMQKVRLSAAVCLLTIGMFYFAEEFYTVQTISGMEKTYNSLSERRFDQNRSATVEPGFLNSAKDMYDIIKGDKGSLELPGDWMLVRKSELLEILKEYNKYAGLNLADTKEDLKLKKILSDEDYGLLMEKRNEIRKLINRYLPGGEK